jgi:NAD(P)-dependent dehydrogenase (short-subunit alcohol dehydrogenase family)
VTGAGGSIGSELCRQIARFGVSRLVCVDVSEYAIYQLEQELRAAHPQMQGLYYTANVRESARLEAIAQREQTVGSLPCGGLQARAADGGTQRDRGPAHQRAGYLACGAGGGSVPGEALRHDFHRQGGQPDQRDGRDQAHGRTGGAGRGGGVHGNRVRVRALSAMCWDRAVRWSRCLRPRSRAAGRSP